MGIQFSVELTAVLIALAGLASWLYALGRRAVTKADIAFVDTELRKEIEVRDKILREYIASKVSKDESDAKFDRLTAGMSEIKDMILRMEDHTREDARTEKDAQTKIYSEIREDIRQLRSEIIECPTAHKK